MKRHDTDVTSLVFGLLFLGVAVMWPLTQLEILTLPSLGMAGPVLLIAVGVVGLLASLARSRPRGGEDGSTPRDVS